MKSDSENSSMEPAKPNNSAPQRRIPSLDGIRTLAVALVCLCHAVNHPGISFGILSGTWIEPMSREGGRFGVLLFFVLSGYLITTLLIREQAKKGRIAIGEFWYRRAFRILPVFVVYLAVVGLLTLSGTLDITWKAFASAATYTWNYQFLYLDSSSIGSDWSVLGHIWSLSVEEQFYLFFPLLVAALMPRKAMVVCLFLIVLTPPLRVVQYFAFPAIRDYGPVMGHSLFGASIAIGCWLAFAEHLKAATTFRSLLATRSAFITALLYGLVVHPVMVNRFGGAWSLPVGETLASFSAASIIVYSIRHATTSWAGRLFNWAPVAWLGVISYSLYIWQQLFYHFDLPGYPGWLSRGAMTVCAILAATSSYYLLELPMLRLRDKWQSSVFGQPVLSAAQSEGSPLLIGEASDS